MQPQEQGMRAHFGWWLEDRLNRHFHRNKKKMADTLGLTITRIRQYFLMETPDDFPEVRAVMVEELLGMKRGQLYEQWRTEPVAPPIRDRRGRRPGAQLGVARIQSVEVKPEQVLGSRMPVDVAARLEALAARMRMSPDELLRIACDVLERVYRR